MFKRLSIAFEAQPLCHKRCGAPDVRDAREPRVDQALRGIASDAHLVGHDRGEAVVRVGRVGEHKRVGGEAFGNVGHAVRHRGEQEPIHAIAVQGGHFLLQIDLAVGVHRGQQIPGFACSFLRAQDDAARIRGGGDLHADESEHARAARAQGPREWVRPVVQRARGVAHPLRDLCLDAPAVAPVEHERDGGYRNAGPLCHFLHRRHGFYDRTAGGMPPAVLCTG